MLGLDADSDSDPDADVLGENFGFSSRLVRTRPTARYALPGAGGAA
jgi:hypothetical protein